jgi:hypothetical protein
LQQSIFGGSAGGDVVDGEVADNQLAQAEINVQQQGAQGLQWQQVGFRL